MLVFPTAQSGYAHSENHGLNGWLRRVEALCEDWVGAAAQRTTAAAGTADTTDHGSPITICYTVTAGDVESGAAAVWDWASVLEWV